MTPDLGIENVRKAIVRNLDMVLNTEGQAGAMEFLKQVKEIIGTYELKLIFGKPIRKRQKSRQG